MHFDWDAAVQTHWCQPTMRRGHTRPTTSRKKGKRRGAKGISIGAQQCEHICTNPPCGEDAPDRRQVQRKEKEGGVKGISIGGAAVQTHWCHSTMWRGHTRSTTSPRKGNIRGCKKAFRLGAQQCKHIGANPPCGEDTPDRRQAQNKGKRRGCKMHFDWGAAVQTHWCQPTMW